MTRPTVGEKAQRDAIQEIFDALSNPSPELIAEMEESRRVLGTIKPEEWQLRFTI